MAVAHQDLLDALASPIRREILWLVWDRELPAGEIAAAFEVTAPTISQHLAVLKAAGLVEMRVDGSFRRYRAQRHAFDGGGEQGEEGLEILRIELLGRRELPDHWTELGA